MHATQPQGGACPEPHPAPGRNDRPENPIVDLLADDERFRTWITQAEATAAAQPSPGPDLKAMTQQEFYHWATGSTGAPASPEPTDSDGYVVTEAGLRALDEAATGGAPGTVVRVLRSAALYLERHGWIQGSYYDTTATVFTPAACLVGAIGMVCYGGPVDAPAQHFDDPGFADFEEAVLHLDRYLLVEDGRESYEFNDAKDRRIEDVCRVLRQAADTSPDEVADTLRVLNEVKDALRDNDDMCGGCHTLGDEGTGGDGA